tara:strand:- start:371 stop:1270 length:900 start_codon:yes stop_codon:yes gene_type:complete
MATVTSSSPFLDSMLNDLAVRAWEQSGGNTQAATKLYSSMLAELVDQTVRGGVSQESAAQEGKVREGVSGARMAGIESRHALSMDLQERQRLLQKEVFERAAGLNSLGAAVAVGVKAFQAHGENDPATKDESAQAAAIDAARAELKAVPSMSSQAKDLSLGPQQAVDPLQDSLGLPDPSLTRSPPQPFAEEFLGTELTDPQAITPPGVLDSELRGGPLLSQAAEPSPEAIAGEGFQPEQKIITAQAEDNLEESLDGTLGALLKGKIDSILDEELTFSGARAHQGRGMAEDFLSSGFGGF